MMLSNKVKADALWKMSFIKGKHILCVDNKLQGAHLNMLTNVIIIIEKHTLFNEIYIIILEVNY